MHKFQIILISILVTASGLFVPCLAIQDEDPRTEGTFFVLRPLDTRTTVDTSEQEDFEFPPIKLNRRRATKTTITISAELEEEARIRFNIDSDLMRVGRRRRNGFRLIGLSNPEDGRIRRPGANRVIGKNARFGDRSDNNTDEFDGPDRERPPFNEQPVNIRNNRRRRASRAVRLIFASRREFIERFGEDFEEGEIVTSINIEITDIDTGFSRVEKFDIIL